MRIIDNIDNYDQLLMFVHKMATVCRFESDGTCESTAPAFSGLDPASEEDLKDLEGCPEDQDDDPDAQLDESDEEEPQFGAAEDIY